jgi:hypothetical protein
MTKRGVITSAVGLVLVSLLGFGYYRLMVNQSEALCGFCLRPIHAHARVIAEVGGRRKTVCCARCAMTEAFQEKKPVRLIEVTDYVSGKTLKPEHAYFVEGSRKILCDHDAAVFDETKHAHPLAFDRCSPGAYAFARLEDAVAFTQENGGVVLQLNEMMRGASVQ